MSLRAATESSFFEQKAIMKHSYIFLLLLSISCHSCYTEQYPDSRLQEKKDIVLALLAPDSSGGFVRENAIEVFVGKIVPVDIRNIYTVFGMQDSLLKRLMISTRQHYIASYEYDASARVVISGPGGPVELAYVDRGIYRDVDRRLSIKTGELYILDVDKNDGRHFTSSTRILDPTAMVGLADTVLLQPEPKTLWDTAFVSFNGQARSIYYVGITTYKTYPHFVVEGYTFEPLFTPPIFFKQNLTDTVGVDFAKIDMQVMSIDSAYGLFHQPHGHSMSREFGDWDITLYDIPIEKRSNINGKNVVGVFGNYTADFKSIVFKADW